MRILGYNRELMTVAAPENARRAWRVNALAQESAITINSDLLATPHTQALDQFIGGVTQEVVVPFKENGIAVELGTQPDLVKARAARFFESMVDIAGRPLTSRQTSNWLYLLHTATDSNGRNIDKIKQIETMREGRIPDVDYATQLGILDADCSPIINSHFSHLHMKHTRLVATPAQLVESAWLAVNNDPTFRYEYLGFVAAIAEMGMQSEMKFETYLLDYLSHRLYELGEFNQDAAIFASNGVYPGLSNRSGALGKGLPLQRSFVDNVIPVSRWPQVLLSAFKQAHDQDERFFDPHKIYTHAGIVREFKGRYSPDVNRQILQDAAKRDIVISSAVVLGGGVGGFEAVDVMEELHLDQISQVDSMAFPETYTLMPRVFKKFAGGRVYRTANGINFGATDSALERHLPTNIVADLPIVDIMGPNEAEVFKLRRRRIKPVQDDLLGDLVNSQELLGANQVVYLRGIACLYNGDHKTKLYENALKYLDPAGGYLVIQDILHDGGRPFCTSTIVHIQSEDDGTLKVNPLSFQMRPFDFEPAQTLATQQLLPATNIRDTLLRFWS